MDDNDVCCGRTEIIQLSKHGRRGSHAFLLLVHLGGEYADLCRAGGTFTITPKVHARSGEPYRWTRERYEISRNMLLRTGFIEQAEPFRMTESGPRPARYRLTMKGLEPVELRRAKKQLTLAPPGNVLPI